VVFDFALCFDKPVIYTDTKFDKAPYDYWWMDEEVWTLGALEKIGEKVTEDNLEAIKEVIDDCLENPRYAEGRDGVRIECWKCCGEGAEKTVDYLVSKYEELKTKED
jgi:hypothetical protein